MEETTKKLLKKLLKLSFLLIYSFILEKVAFWGGLNFSGETALAVSVVFRFLALIGYSICIYEYVVQKIENR